MLNSFDHSEFALERLIEVKGREVTVCIPAKETAATIGATVERIVPLAERGLVDQLLVVDADSADRTAEVARRAGAEVRSENELLPSFGPVEGKGDAMWRALAATRSEIVVFLDGDVGDFGPHYVSGLLGPLLTRDGIDFVKARYRRPFTAAGQERPDGGGRVTELTAKPLLELTAPELARFDQPLAGEQAARRELFERIPFMTGYGVEIAMLAEVWMRVGLSRMAEVDLGTKRNDHQELPALAAMAREVVEALAMTLEGGGAKIEGGGAKAAGTLVPAAGHRARLTVRPPLREAVGA